jgi:hypothetical protein
MNKGFLAHFSVDVHNFQCVQFSYFSGFQIYRFNAEKSWIFSGQRIPGISENNDQKS